MKHFCERCGKEFIEEQEWNEHHCSETISSNEVLNPIPLPFDDIPKIFHVRKEPKQ